MDPVRTIRTLVVLAALSTGAAHRSEEHHRLSSMPSACPAPNCVSSRLPCRFATLIHCGRWKGSVACQRKEFTNNLVVVVRPSPPKASVRPTSIIGMNVHLPIACKGQQLTYNADMAVVACKTKASLWPTLICRVHIDLPRTTQREQLTDHG